MSLLFIKALSPISLGIFSSNTEHLDYKCLYSNNTLYKQGATYSSYDIPPLLRTLLTKNQILNDSDILGLYDKGPYELCYIQEWNDYIKKVIVFNLDELTYFDEVKFNEILSNQSGKLSLILEKALQLDTHQRDGQC